MIPIQEFNAGLAELEIQSAEWYRAKYGFTCQMCVDSIPSRDFLLVILNHLMELMRTGGDFSTPLVMLAGTMLQMGYAIGRRTAEAEILEGWMTL